MSRLDARMRPLRYDLHVAVDPRRDRFRGEVEIELVTDRATRSIELHAVDLDFGETQVWDERGEIPVERCAPRARRETIELRLGRPLAKGSGRLRIAYEGPLRSDLRGLYLARSGKRRYAATQLEAADARRFFPCFDEPSMKARFRISVTTPERNQVVTNGAELRTVRNGRQKTVEFNETPPLSTYLIALIVGELEASRPRKLGDTPIRVWHVPGKGHLTRFALEAAVESLRRLERYFGLPYPYDKLDLIAVPDFEFGAMENAGAVTFREGLLLVDPKTITLQEKKRVAEVIAHELAHMWYGDLVTMAWWDDLWLNEAFATWMAFTVVDDWKPEWRMWLDFQHDRSAAYSRDAMKTTHPIYTEVGTPDEATENFDVITYEKGASVVRMLERWLGSATFRRGVRAYIRRHREGNAVAADLWSALEEASGIEVAPMVRSWIARPGFPLVSVEQKRVGRREELTVRQERFFSSPRVPDAPRRETWPIPLVVRVRPARGRVRLERHLVTRRTQRLRLGRANSVRWVYANADEGSFVRPLHGPKLLGAIGADLRRLAPVERMGLLGHQWAGLRADRASLDDFLGLAERLVGETEPEVLEALIGPLSVLESVVAPAAGKARGDGSADFRAWLAERFGPPFESAGWRPRRGESDRDRLRRAALLRIAGGVAEAPAIVADADERARAYLRDRGSLDPNLAGPVVDLAARDGDKALYQRYLQTMRRAATPQERTRFELCLASFRDPALVERTLELALTDDVPTQDVVPLLTRLMANRSARETTWQFIQARWDALSPRISPGLAPRLVTSLSSLGTRAYRREVSAFFWAHKMPTAERALRQTLEQFDLDADLRRRTGPALRRYLHAV